MANSGQFNNTQNILHYENTQKMLYDLNMIQTSDSSTFEMGCILKQTLNLVHYSKNQ